MRPKKIKYAKIDYHPSSLPHNRKAAFRDIYQTRFILIMKCAGTLLLFSLPLLIANFVLDLGRFSTAAMNEEQLLAFSFYWNIAQKLLSIIGLFILLVGVSGLLRIFKLMIWQEGVVFLTDFVIGIKENIKSMEIFSLIYAFLYALAYAQFLIFKVEFVSYGGLAFVLVIFTPLYLWCLVLSNTYRSKWILTVKNSVFFFAKTVPMSLLFTLLISWPFLISNLLPNVDAVLFMVKYALSVVLILFYYPAIIIWGLLYSAAKFDKYINIENYPELYRKGLYDASDDEEN